MVKFILFSTNFLKSCSWSHQYLTFYWQIGTSLFLFANKICLDLRKKLFQTIFILKALVSEDYETVKLFLREAQKFFWASSEAFEFLKRFPFFTDTIFLFSQKTFPKSAKNPKLFRNQNSGIMVKYSPLSCLVLRNIRATL